MFEKEQAEKEQEILEKKKRYQNFLKENEGKYD
jgi:hypothetical protein